MKFPAQEQVPLKVFKSDSGRPTSSVGQKPSPATSHVHDPLHAHVKYSTLLAIQRTLLAYVRTSISVAALAHISGTNKAWIGTTAGFVGFIGILQCSISSTILADNTDLDLKLVFQILSTLVALCAVIVGVFTVSAGDASEQSFAHSTLAT